MMNEVSSVGTPSDASGPSSAALRMYAPTGKVAFPPVVATVTTVRFSMASEKSCSV